MRFILIAALALLCVSCSDEQIARAQAAVASSDAQLAQANELVATATKAVDAAKAVNAQVHNEAAAAALDQATLALGQVQEAQKLAALTNQGAHDAVDSAKAAKDAGESTVGVLLAAGKGAVPMALAALLAGFKWWQAAKESNKANTSLRQTVVGLQEARDTLGETVWKASVAPALVGAQDEATKEHVNIVLAKNA